MAGEKLADFPKRPPYKTVDDSKIADQMTLADPDMPWFSVKEAVLPFARFPGVDTILGPEMRSTGEVMGWDRDFPRAFLKAQIGAGMVLPSSGRAFISIKDADKGPDMLEAARVLVDQGFELVATRGTQTWLDKQGVPCEVVNKVYEGRPDVTDLMKDGGVQLVMNSTEGAQAVEDSRSIRSIALYDKIPYFTTAAASHAAALAIKAQAEGDVEVKSLQG
jgi:carbamoyl-phosphate synthase large subunit